MHRARLKCPLIRLSIYSMNVLLRAAQSHFVGTSGKMVLLAPAVEYKALTSPTEFVEKDSSYVECIHNVISSLVYSVQPDHA